MIVYPTATSDLLLLTAEGAISHRDPAVQDKSNRSVFNRQKQFLAVEVTTRFADTERMALVAQAHPVPVDIADILEGIEFPEFLAVVLLKTFMDIYNSMDGVGLFSGTERYEYLMTRARSAAIPSRTLRGWWDRLCRELHVGIHGSAWDVALYDLLSVPLGTQQAVLRSLCSSTLSNVALARLWHSTSKLESEAYAQAAGQMAMIQPKRTLSFADAGTVVQGAIEAEVPAVSGNTMRHQFVREPGWYHLLWRLGLSAATPGQGPVPPGVEALFCNGGNIEAGAKALSGAHGLAWQIRGLYPLLDLLGGVTDTFDLGESALQVAAWLVCAENRSALVGTGAYDLPMAQVSVYDMLDDVTQTRQASPQGIGQMIQSFEVLSPGVQVMLRLTCRPQTSELTRGALIAAVRYALDNDPTIGGVARVGFGRCTGTWLSDDSAYDGLSQGYEDYLRDNAEALVAGLMDGTLGTGKQVLT